MKKILPHIVLLCSFLAMCTPHVFADDVGAFVFVTTPQTIDPGQLSKEITVQSQTAGGVSQPIPETYDLAFTSTSNTGQFLNSSGNAVSTTMSKNTANRTFYYKDGTAGDFILTVTATGRDSKKSFTASQHIYIGQPLPSGSGTSTSTQATSTTTTETQSTSVSSISTHSSPIPLSNTEEEMNFQISAGRDRLTTTGSDVVFRVVPTKTQGVSENNIHYEWSFGDGSIAQGQIISHTYSFPGEYVVVVTGSYLDKQAVSRIVITVVAPEVVIRPVDGGVEVWNKSSTEVNLADWVLFGGQSSFTFPKDTIIEPKKKIIFDNDVTHVNAVSIGLKNSRRTAIAEYNAPLNSQSLAVLQVATSSLENIRAQISKIQENITRLEPAHTVALVPSVHQVVQIPVTVAPKKDDRLASSTKVENLAQAVSVFEAPQKTSMLGRVFAWPIASADFIRHLFTEE